MTDREDPQVVTGRMSEVHQALTDCRQALERYSETGNRTDKSAWKSKAGVLEVFCVGHARALILEIKALREELAQRDAALGVARRAILRAAQDTLWCDDVAAETVVDRIDAIAGGPTELPCMPSDDGLLRNAVRLAVPRFPRGYRPRWVAVMDTFAVGSTVAQSLCARFDFNPDEKVRRK